MTSLFVNLDANLYAAIDEVAYFAGLTKRTLISGTIANAAGLDHPDAEIARRAWRRYTRKIRQETQP